MERISKSLDNFEFVYQTIYHENFDYDSIKNYCPSCELFYVVDMEEFDEYIMVASKCKISDNILFIINLKLPNVLKRIQFKKNNSMIVLEY